MKTQSSIYRQKNLHQNNLTNLNFILTQIIVKRDSRTQDILSTVHNARGNEPIPSVRIKNTHCNKKQFLNYKNIQT